MQLKTNLNKKILKLLKGKNLEIENNKFKQYYHQYKQNGILNNALKSNISPIENLKQNKLKKSKFKKINQPHFSKSFLKSDLKSSFLFTNQNKLKQSFKTYQSGSLKRSKNDSKFLLKSIFQNNIFSLEK